MQTALVRQRRVRPAAPRTCAIAAALGLAGAATAVPQPAGAGDIKPPTQAAAVARPAAKPQTSADGVPHRRGPLPLETALPGPAMQPPPHSPTSGPHG